MGVFGVDAQRPWARAAGGGAEGADGKPRAKSETYHPYPQGNSSGPAERAALLASVPALRLDRMANGDSSSNNPFAGAPLPKSKSMSAAAAARPPPARSPRTPKVPRLALIDPFSVLHGAAVCCWWAALVSAILGVDR
jgi:hypothetical protein